MKRVLHVPAIESRDATSSLEMNDAADNKLADCAAKRSHHPRGL
jgi:hypothetical protein